MNVAEVKTSGINAGSQRANTQGYLRLAADRSGLSDLEIAKKAGISQSTVYRMLNANTFNPSFSNVCSVCACLGVPLPSSLSVDFYEGIHLIGMDQSADVPEKIKKEAGVLLTSNRMLMTGIVTDDSEGYMFPKMSILQYSDVGTAPVLNDNDITIVELIFHGSRSLIPMRVSAAVEQGYYIITDLKDGDRVKHMYIISKGERSVSSGPLKVTIVGKLVKAMINYV